MGQNERPGFHCKPLSTFEYETNNSFIVKGLNVLRSKFAISVLQPINSLKDKLSHLTYSACIYRFTGIYGTSIMGRSMHTASKRAQEHLPVSLKEGGISLIISLIIEAIAIHLEKLESCVQKKLFQSLFYQGLHAS